MVVKLSDRVEVEWFKQIGPVWESEPDEIPVSGIGTITAARVTPKDGSIEPFIAVSMYGRWLGPHPSAVGDWIYSDASAHRIISDLSDVHRLLRPPVRTSHTGGRGLEYVVQQHG